MNLVIKVDKKRPLPIYRQIKEELLKLIRQQNLSPGALMPSIKLVAEAAGVSLRTADLAMQALVDEGFCFRRPKKGTFVADSEQFEVKPICGIWCSHDPQTSHQDMVFSRLYQGIFAAAVERPLDASLIFDEPEKQIRLYNRIDSFDFRGILVLESNKFRQTLELARLFPDKKFVFLNYRMRGIESSPENVYAVINDDYSGAYRLAERFIANGCRRMAVVSWRIPDPNDLTYQERLRGFRQAAADYALDFDPAVDFMECSDPLSSHQRMLTASYLAAKKYLYSGRSPEVIFSTNDFLANGIKRCIEDEGLSGKVQAVGYDCLDAEMVLQSGLSSVQVEYAAMGRTGVDILCSDRTDFPRLTKIEPKLKIILSQGGSSHA